MKDLKKFFVKTYGCQMNELDTELMVGQLIKRGLERVYDEKAADLLIFNTCSIRDLAERKVMGKIGQLARSSKKRNSIIGVTGCMAMAKKESLFRKLPHIDFVLGTNNITDLNSVLDEVLRTSKQTIKTDSQFEENLDYLVAKRDDKVKAYVSIIRGCDKFCTYCVVPYTRGQEVSRPPEDIVNECKKLASEGYKEVTLLGQNVNSYGKDQKEWNCLFHDLLYKLDKIEGLERVRFMTSHPIDITRELMEGIRDLDSLCEFVHFPIQAGSSRVLKKMHRIYTKEQYLEKVTMLRDLVPNVSIGTDIIVGFPTETEEEFQETYDILKDIRYSVAFLFAYSARKGTPAMRWKDDITEEIKQERLQRLIRLQDTIYAEQRQVLLGHEMEVLVDKRGTRDGKLKGRTRCWKNVVFEHPDDAAIGTLQTIKIHSYNHQTMIGDLVKAPELALV
ncbi:tRNA (N6-isopentenyl adenosine(37)-C2)-methylthiotransferase MiaB [Candidatus Aerophobetes bacterium]|uniref:tRNA-2-methylthio-N(6)-dimethylallyladenosine synthase n=1 Tax=Aerophobetes bacterium TaxID=2030807 RepID=A0A2A4YKR0_UNCAE|nr:MAG: tRNA (N6-isopentenyl adenosine(37)-C2)-methylthiotransferase MiaB [Candidatus Aerophobetes bacterium]